MDHALLADDINDVYRNIDALMHDVVEEVLKYTDDKGTQKIMTHSRMLVHELDRLGEIADIIGNEKTALPFPAMLLN